MLALLALAFCQAGADSPVNAETAGRQLLNSYVIAAKIQYREGIKMLRDPNAAPKSTRNLPPPRTAQERQQRVKFIQEQKQKEADFKSLVTRMPRMQKGEIDVVAPPKLDKYIDKHIVPGDVRYLDDIEFRVAGVRDDGSRIVTWEKLMFVLAPELSKDAEIGKNVTVKAWVVGSEMIDLPRTVSRDKVLRFDPFDYEAAQQWIDDNKTEASTALATALADFAPVQ